MKYDTENACSITRNFIRLRTEYVVNILKVRTCFVLLIVLDGLFVLVYTVLYFDLYLLCGAWRPVVSEQEVL